MRRDEPDAWISDLPPLVRAAALGDAHEVATLLSVGVSPDAADEDGWSALHAAAARGHIAVVEKLLAAGATVDLETRDGFTPLLNACGPGTPPVVEALLAAGADVGHRDPRFGWTPLSRAVEYGHGDIVTLLIDAGAIVDEPDDQGQTPLMAAAEGGDLPTVERLLAAGADPTTAVDGETALKLAQKHGHMAVAAVIAAAADHSQADRV